MKSVGMARCMARCVRRVWVESKMLVVDSDGLSPFGRGSGRKTLVIGPKSFEMVKAEAAKNTGKLFDAETLKMPASLSFCGMPVVINADLDAHWESRGHPLRRWAYRYLAQKARRR